MRCRAALLGALLAVAAAPRASATQCTTPTTNNSPVNTTGPFYPSNTCNTVYGCSQSCPYGCIRCSVRPLAGRVLVLGRRAERLRDRLGGRQGGLHDGSWAAVWASPSRSARTGPGQPASPPCPAVVPSVAVPCGAPAAAPLVPLPCCP